MRLMSSEEGIPYEARDERGLSWPHATTEGTR
jgi:hypothetical protein